MKTENGKWIMEWSGKRSHCRHSSFSAFHFPSAPAALTLVELVIGMVLTSLVLGALAAFTAAAGQSWSAADAPQNLRIKSMAVQSRVETLLRQALAIGYLNPGSLDSSTTPAGVMLWRNDAMGQDGEKPKIQVGEVGWVDYDPTTSTLSLYRASESITPAVRTAAIRPMPVPLASPVAPTLFKSLAASFLVRQTLATDVSGAWFSVRDTGDVNGRPSVEFVIRLRDDSTGREAICYGNASLEHAQTPTQ